MLLIYPISKTEALYVKLALLFGKTVLLCPWESDTGRAVLFLIKGRDVGITLLWRRAL